MKQSERPGVVKGMVHLYSTTSPDLIRSIPVHYTDKEWQNLITSTGPIYIASDDFSEVVKIDQSAFIVKLVREGGFEGLYNL